MGFRRCRMAACSQFPLTATMMSSLLKCRIREREFPKNCTIKSSNSTSPRRQKEAASGWRKLIKSCNGTTARWTSNLPKPPALFFAFKFPPWGHYPKVIRSTRRTPPHLTVEISPHRAAFVCHVPDKGVRLFDRRAGLLYDSGRNFDLIAVLIGYGFTIARCAECRNADFPAACVTNDRAVFAVSVSSSI